MSTAGAQGSRADRPGLLIQDAQVAGRRRDVRILGGVVAEVGTHLRPRPGEPVLAAGGGALLPGLQDHHLHLMALAAAQESLCCGPPVVTDRRGLMAALRAAPGTGWLRGTSYHESVAGPLDRAALDALVPDRPVRVQHRSGALWMLNSPGLALLGLERETSPDVERDAAGRLTGRLWRWDSGLRRALGGTLPDLPAAGRLLAGLGVTGVTDATPDLDEQTTTVLRSGLVPQRLQLLGAPDHLACGAPRKLHLHDHDLPDFDRLVGWIDQAHGAGRPVAVHCVTRESLLLTLAALEQTGGAAGDRIEHAAVVPDGVAATLARQRLRVVTQPAFVSERGDHYRREVAPEDQPGLYPYASLLAAGVPVAPSSDAPFGDVDPWRAMAAAVSRQTPSGVVLGAHERVAARQVLRGYLSPLQDPGGPPRRVRPGVPADLCLLHVPLQEALRAPSRELVRLVLIAGQVSGR